MLNDTHYVPDNHETGHLDQGGELKAIPAFPRFQLFLTR